VSDAMATTPIVETNEFENLERLQSLFRDPDAQERLSNLGVRTAFVATWDGLLIDSVVCDDEPVELDALAADAAATLQMSHAAPSRGRVDGVTAEFEGGSSIIVDPVGENSLVAFVTKPSTDIAQVRHELRTMAQVNVDSGTAPVVTRGGQKAPTANPPARVPQGQREPAPRHTASVPRQGQSASPATHTASPAAAIVQEIVRRTPAGSRVILKGVALDTAGFAATATVELVLNGKKVIGKAVARNDSAQYLFVAADATVRAITALLPEGYGVVLEHIMPVASEVDQSIRAVSVKVLFLTPTGEQTLLGIAKITGDEPIAAAKTVLSAVNTSIESLIGQPGERIH
jgi:predicted regulator of Ras-like GTPase activity (Roadblock/LC7/MglB family)